MVAITLSAEDVRAAPPEVRHWLEQRVAAMLAAAPAEPHETAPALAVCAAEEAGAILTQIQDLLPAVAVFFELGREPAAMVGQEIRAFSLAEMARHARLRSAEQVIECLDVINQVFAGVRKQAEARLCSVDAQGHCFVAEPTSRAILALWHGIVAARGLPDSRAAAR